SGATGATSGATGATSGATGATGGATGATGGATGATGGATGATGGATGATGGATGATGATGGATGMTSGETTEPIGDGDAGAMAATDDMMGGGEFTLTSAELTEGEDFPEAHTCSMPGMGPYMFGAPISLTWSGVPEGTQSFALVMLDVTLTEQTPPDQNGYHSA